MVLTWSKASKTCRQNGKQCRPWSGCSSRSSLIWVYTVCPELSVQKFMTITVLWKIDFHLKFWRCQRSVFTNYATSAFWLTMNYFGNVKKIQNLCSNRINLRVLFLCTKSILILMFLSFRTDTGQTQIRLLLKEQSDQDLCCLPFLLHLLGALLYGRAILFKY